MEAVHERLVRRFSRRLTQATGKLGGDARRITYLTP